MNIRKAEKAGAWYPDDSGQLRDALAEYCDYAVPDEINEPVAGIVPHAGLAFSGPTAGKVFTSLKSADPETIIILGAVHTMFLNMPSVWGKGAWQTPLGDVAVDEDLAKVICDADIAQENHKPHNGDNAIELQMPFVKYCFPEAKIVPIAVPPLVGIEKLGQFLHDIVSGQSKKIVILGSTDFTHYGDSFGVTPAGYGEKALEWSKENDRKLIDFILNFESDKIVETSQDDHSACGAGAVAALTQYAKECEAKGVLLEHTTSYDVMPQGEASHFVGYAGIVFSK